MYKRDESNYCQSRVTLLVQSARNGHIGVCELLLGCPDAIGGMRRGPFTVRKYASLTNLDKKLTKYSRKRCTQWKRDSFNTGNKPGIAKISSGEFSEELINSIPSIVHKSLSCPKSTATMGKPKNHVDTKKVPKNPARTQSSCRKVTGGLYFPMGNINEKDKKITDIQ